MSTTLVEPELGCVVITIPDTIGELLERIDEESDEWVLVIRESKWFKQREAVRLSFRAPVPAPGVTITRKVTWCVDRCVHIVGAHVEGPTPEWSKQELRGDLEAWLISGDYYSIVVTLTNCDRPA